LYFYTICKHKSAKTVLVSSTRNIHSRQLCQVTRCGSVFMFIILMLVLESGIRQIRITTKFAKQDYHLSSNTKFNQNPFSSISEKHWYVKVRSIQNTVLRFEL